jgi:hypothetical protein
MLHIRPTQRRFLPVKGTTQVFAIGPRLKKKPRFKPLPFKVKVKSGRLDAPVTPQEALPEPVKVGVVTSLWVCLSAGVGHKVDLNSNSEVALCGRNMANAKPYHGDKFCKRCLAVSH